MKHILIIIIFTGVAVSSSGQPRKFKGLADYEKWIMNYYKDPQPDLLFDGFTFGVHNKKIAAAGNRSMIIAFFSSCLRNDTIRQQTFYQKIKDTRDADVIYAFGLTLWQAHTDFSLSLMDRFLMQDNTAKYIADFEKFKAAGFTNIWTDSIKHPEHLDMLWADFFATGNPESVKKIISKLSDLNSPDHFDVVTAGSAQWSLASNSARHPRVLDICTEERQDADGEIREALDKILEAANRQKQSGN